MMTMDTLNDDNNYNDNTTTTDKSLNEAIQCLLNDHALSDVELESADGVLIPVHKCILGARSTVFRSMLCGVFKESQSSTVKVGFDGEVLRAIVEYCYTDDISIRKNTFDDSTSRTIVRLMECADYFGLSTLVQKLQILACAKMRIDPPLACAVLDETEMMNAEVTSKLNRVALEIIRLDRSACLLPDKSSKGLGVLSLRAMSLEKVLSNDELCTDEFTLYRSLHIWTMADQDNRMDIAANLCKNIRLENIKPSILSKTVALSSLAPPEQLSHAFQTQAILAEGNKLIFPKMRNRSKLVVRGAGIIELNGEYFPSGLYDGVAMYQKTVIWEEQFTTFTLFRWEQKHWYIADVPDGDPTNTVDTNVDFYYAPATGHELEQPPFQWYTVHEMDHPPPILRLVKHDGKYADNGHFFKPIREDSCRFHPLVKKNDLVGSVTAANSEVIIDLQNITMDSSGTDETEC